MQEEPERDPDELFVRDICRWCLPEQEILVTIGFTSKKNPVKACEICDSRTDGKSGLVSNQRRGKYG